MKTSVSIYEFRKWFTKNRPDNFSYAGLSALYDYLEDYENGCGIEIEFDPVAICCEFDEYEDFEEFRNYYDSDEYNTREKLMDYTIVIEIPDSEGFIIQAF